MNPWAAQHYCPWEPAAAAVTKKGKLGLPVPKWDKPEARARGLRARARFCQPGYFFALISTSVPNTA